MNTVSDEYIELVREKYQVESVVGIDAPEGMVGNDWHRYTIAYKKTKIQGMMPGSLFNVTQHAEEFAENLNERSGRYGGHSKRTKK
jgi:hypothetical protein